MKKVALSLALPILGITLLAQVIDISIGIPRTGAGGAGVSTLLNDLVAYWNLDEQSGTRAKTAGSCVSCDLTAVNAPGIAGGAGSYAVSTANTGNKFLSVSDNADLSISDITFGVCAWVYGVTGTTGEIAGKGTTLAREYFIDANAGNFRFYVKPDGFNAVTTPFSAGRHLVCGWHLTSDQKQYIDVDASGTPASLIRNVVPADGTGAFAVGNFADTGFGWTGTIGPVMFWKNGIPNASDMTSLYNSGKGYTCSALPASLRTNLVACWDLNEASGTRVASNVGSCTTNCDLSAVNAPGRTAGLVENGMGLSANFINAASQGLSLTDNADLSMGPTQSFEFSTWYNATTLRDSAISGLTGKYQANHEYLLYQAAGRNVQCVLFNGADRNAPLQATGAANTWKFITCYYDDLAKLWNVTLNGVANGSPTTVTSGAQDSNAAFVIGSYNNTNYHDGSIDAVGVWKRVLTSSERAALYNAGAGVEYPWTTIVNLFFNPNTRWAAIPIETKQRMIYLKTGVYVPEAFFPSFSRMN